ncbi:MAG TPA: hypothetical protein VIK56_14385, partial [Rhodoferax sp.]
MGSTLSDCDPKDRLAVLPLVTIRPFEPELSGKAHQFSAMLIAQQRAKCREVGDIRIQNQVNACQHTS